MEKKQLVQRLESHGIKPTANRIRIAEALEGSEHPMTLSELEAELETIDKSNVFRTLVLFRDRHFIHQVEDGCEGMRYECCHSSHEDVDDDMHVHFHCEKCHTTFCLPDIPIPRVPLPEGYSTEAINYMVKGICPACARKH